MTIPLLKRPLTLPDVKHMLPDEDWFYALEELRSRTRALIAGWKTTVPLEIVRREHEGIEVLDLKGKLTFGHEDLDFRKEIAALLQAGNLRVALNLKDLRQLDTVGLGTLIFAVETMRKAGGNLAVFNLTFLHGALLAESHLETTIEAFPTEQDAIDSFFPGRQVTRYDILEFVEAQQRTHGQIPS